jgi:hypothetical protein
LRGKGGEMTQTLYAYMNKRKKNVICNTPLKQKRAISGKLLLTQKQKHKHLNLMVLVF